MTIKSKKCTKCGRVKPLEDFYKDSTVKSGRHSSCKMCEKKRFHIYRTSEQGKQRTKRYNQSEHGKEVNKRKDLKYRQAHRKVRERKKPTPRKKCCKCKQVKLLRYFGKANATYDGRQTICKACGLKYKREFSRTKKGKASNRRNQLNQKYGITPQKYDEILKEQNGGCAICGGINENGRRLAVDHNHTTGEIRGLLCNKCNSVLGWAGDSIAVLAGAIKYLNKTEDIQW